MDAKTRRNIIQGMQEKLRKNERLSLSEVGMYDVLYRKTGSKPTFPLPKWLQNRKSIKEPEVKEYYD